MKKIIKQILIILVLIYLAANAYLYFYQDSLIFKNKQAQKVELLNTTNTKEIKFKVEENINLYGKYKKATIPSKTIILYFGGNSSDITSFFNHIQNITNYDVIAFNYRGYINSKGNPSQKAFFSDALNIYDKYTKNKEVIIIGKSLGTGMATYLASKRKSKAVVLITPYDSISSMAKKKYPIFPIDLLLKHKFESIKYIQDIKVPVALIEVKNDLTIKKYHFDKLKEKIPNILRHLEFDNVSHSNILSHKDFERSLKLILKDISENK